MGGDSNAKISDGGGGEFFPLGTNSQVVEEELLKLLILIILKTMENYH